MKAWWLRFKEPINNFWKKVRNFAIGLTGICISIIELNKYIEGITIPAQLITICSYIVVAGVVLGVTAQTTTK